MSLFLYFCLRMKKIVAALFLALSLPILASAKATVILLDAETFADRGGWVIDQQSEHLHGTPYLIAHGAGRPVADAVTSVALPHKGKWYVYARSYNWTSPWFKGEGPGAFRILVEGKPVGGILGTEGDCWIWQYAGFFKASGTVTVSLKDLSGFDGRCDLLYLTDKRIDVSSLPSDRSGLDALRREYTPGFFEAEELSGFDLVVAGAGLAGISTAVSAARLGLKVALVHDRFVLGGNNSTEIRVRMGGGICRDPYPNLGNLLIEYAHDETPSARAPENYQEWKKEGIIAAESNITLFRGYRAVSAETADGRMLSVDAREISTGRLVRILAPLFADCTGDGNIGAMAGADYSVGRESRDTYNEPTAPTRSDNNVNGATLQWHSTDTGKPSSFPEFNYGYTIAEKTASVKKEGRWDWQTGWDKDMIDDVERIRDLELNAIYSNWSFVKNHCKSASKFANYELDWVQYILGKRESRRLLGDVVLTENDLCAKTQFPDAAVTTTWDIDLHGMNSKNHSSFPGMEFKGSASHKEVGECTIPYRCFYSRNVSNLFMAGRDISVTHVALGATRVMRTNSMMGEVVGMAASICKRYGCTPREVYTDHLEELKALMREGTGRRGQPNTQEFYLK